ncbi:MAG: flagellar biosynthesis protein FlgJ [Deltaproteobacteria bacterium]|nr:MAG: flagellar biosynthesis protein FlgJ [Deltaproteobacteria bacterium]
MIEKVDSNLGVERQKLKEACKRFEAIFIEYMLRAMRRSVPKAGLFERENAEKIYTSMFDQKLAEKISESQGIGISDMLYKELSKMLSERTGVKKGR